MIRALGREKPGKSEEVGGRSGMDRDGGLGVVGHDW